MIAADQPIQRPAGARLLVVDPQGRITHATRSRLVNFLRPDDLGIANDAATLPASLHGVQLRSGADVEVRLAARSSLAATDVHIFSAVIFGAGDFHIRTEDRPLPPALTPGDRLVFPPAVGEGDRLPARVEAVLNHPRLVRLKFEGSPSTIWEGLARHGRPIQYAHITAPLALWDVWTPIAGLPAAFDPPSASFALDWASLRAMRDRGIAFATVTLAAGISSTSDAALDRSLPFDEPYRISEATASAIRQARAALRRIVAFGTTVVRALEHAAARDGVVRAGENVANERVGAASPLRIVDAIVSGTHDPDSSQLSAVARVRGRRRAERSEHGARGERLPDARIWRFRVDREKRRGGPLCGVSRRTVAKEGRSPVRKTEGVRRTAPYVRGAGELAFATVAHRSRPAFHSC